MASLMFSPYACTDLVNVDVQLSLGFADVILCSQKKKKQKTEGDTMPSVVI